MSEQDQPISRIVERLFSECLPPSFKPFIDHAQAEKILAEYATAAAIERNNVYEPMLERAEAELSRVRGLLQRIVEVSPAIYDDWSTGYSHSCHYCLSAGDDDSTIKHKATCLWSLALAESSLSCKCQHPTLGAGPNIGEVTRCQKCGGIFPESSLSSNDTFPPKTITTPEPMIVEDNKASLSSPPLCLHFYKYETCADCGTDLNDGKIVAAQPSGDSPAPQIKPLSELTGSYLSLKLLDADRLAEAVDKAIGAGLIGSRTPVADARLNYGMPLKYEFSEPSGECTQPAKEKE
jgi:hypothetical protein